MQENNTKEKQKKTMQKINMRKNKFLIVVRNSYPQRGFNTLAHHLRFLFDN
jgi:hypothetical protein